MAGRAGIGETGEVLHRDPIASPQPWWQTPWCLAALLVAATVFAYLPAFDAGFIWDDDDYVTQNPLLREAGGLWRIWFSPTELPQYYPVVHTSFWFEFQLWDMAPAGYHVVNVLLHAANACLVWRIVRRLHIPGALLAAFVFALHPVHVESVAWITERKNVLSGLFYLLALDRWLRWVEPAAAATAAAPPARHLAVAFVCFAAALLSKTVTCSLPAVFLLLTWWRHGRLRRREVLATLPFFALGLVLALVTASLERAHVGAEGAEFAFAWTDRVLIAGRAPWFYLGTLVWPAGLSFNYERWDLDAHSAAQWAFPCATVAVLAALFGLRRRLGRAGLVALLSFGGSLVPALGFFNVYPMRYSFVADHFQYLASLGPIVLFAALAATAAGERHGTTRRAAVAAAALLIVGLGTLTWRQAHVYQNPETLWLDTIAKNPRSWLALTNLARFQTARGDHAAAIAGLERAIAVYEASETRLALGIARLQAGDAAAARVELERAVALAPKRNDAKAFLGHVLHVLGENDRALVVLQQALAFREDYDRARAFTGAVLHALGRHREALPHLERAIELNPMAPDALCTAARVHAALGEGDHAVFHAAHALYRDPDGTATRAAALAVFTDVLAKVSPERASAIAVELQQKVPAVRGLAASLVAELDKRSPEVAAAVRAVLVVR